MNTMLKTTTHPLISEVEDRMRAQFAGNPSALVATIEQLILAGGKRIRPTIILLMGSILDAEREALLNLAAAIEMMHAATLVHDDLVDEAGHMITSVVAVKQSSAHQLEVTLEPGASATYIFVLGYVENEPTRKWAACSSNTRISPSRSCI